MESLTLTLFVSIVTACPRPIHFSLGLTTGILWYLFWRIFTHYHSCIFHSCIFHPCDLLPHFPHPHFQRPLYTCSMSARHQCEASTWRHDAHFATVVRGCCCGCRCRFRVPTPLKLALLAQLAPCLFSTSSSLLLLLLLLSTRSCRDSVWALTEWLTARRNFRRL